jgi:hypothetical protein
MKIRDVVVQVFRPTDTFVGQVEEAKYTWKITSCCCWSTMMAPRSAIAAARFARKN